MGSLIALELGHSLSVSKDRRLRGVIVVGKVIVT